MSVVLGDKCGEAFLMRKAEVCIGLCRFGSQLVFEMS